MSDDRLAVLIDADNTSPRQAREMFEELAGYGTLTVKRAYGDWTSNQLTGWKAQLHAHAISPMQQFAYTTGKNSTDSALIIDAMDLLYAGNVDGFVIVSSDSDFTRLATRLRESGMTVYGLGQRKTPKSFQDACDKFTFLEVLTDTGGARSEKGSGEATDHGEQGDSEDSEGPTRAPDGALHSLMTRCVNKSPQDDEDWTQLGSLGSLLNRTDPSFDPRRYGSAKLSDLVKELPYLESKQVTGSSGRSELWVRLKGSHASGKAAKSTGGRTEKKAAGEAEPGTPEPTTRRTRKSAAKKAAAKS